MRDITEEETDQLNNRMAVIAAELKDILSLPEHLRPYELNLLVEVLFEALPIAASLDDLYPPTRMAINQAEIDRGAWTQIISSLDIRHQAELIAALPTTIEGRKNSRLAFEVTDHISRDEAQDLYHFGVLVTKLYS